MRTIIRSIQITASAILLSVAFTTLSAAQVEYGPAHSLGDGQVRSFAVYGVDDEPLAIGVLMDEAALDRLPPQANNTSRCFDINGNGKIDTRGECEGDLETRLSLPDKLGARKDVPFRWIAINWNAKGHPPKAWSVPHFDFHFYISTRAEIDAIRVGPCNFFIHCDDLKTALKPAPEKYVAKDHIDVKAAVSKMGNHLIDSRTPELGEPPVPFTHTWIYGAFDGRITFYEPMITLAFLKQRPNVCQPIRQPLAWETSGYYPTIYCIRYLSRRKAFSISLEGLLWRNAG